MKTLKLFFMMALVGLFQTTYAQLTVSVSGQLTNTNSAPINVWLNINDSGTWQSTTVTTDVNGNYSTSFTVNATQGQVVMYAYDCNNDSILSTQSFNPGATNVIFPTFDYCPNGSTSCQAFFSVDQALDANGSPVAGTLVVTDSSYGSNPAANLTYSWDFGDGNNGSGTQLTHSYAGNGPYVLCLTISDNFGCSDTYCDTISVDSSGMIIEELGFDLIIGEYNPPLNITSNPQVVIQKSCKIFKKKVLQQ